MSVLRVSMLIGLLEGTCELLFGGVLILAHALAFPVIQPLQFRVSVPHPYWMLQVYDYEYDWIPLVRLEEDPKNLRGSSVPQNQRKTVGPKG